MLKVESKALRKAAKGQPCVRCGRNDGTVVGAHYQGLRAHLLGKGRSIKPTDLAIADFCRTCHEFMDGYGGSKRPLSYEEKIDLSEQFLFYVLQTLHRRIEQGMITVKGFEP